MTEVHPPQLTAEGDMCLVTDDQGRVLRLPSYRYRPLPSKRTIRLLRALAPLQQMQLQMKEYELVEYELPNTNIQDLDVSSSHYIAMSYCWGASTANAPLLITTQGQKKILPVTANAWEAIDRTVPAITIGGQMMWIDQVCIHQRDAEERAQQVELMGEIYRRCWHCMIWLGPAEANTETAYALLQRLHQTFDQYQPIPIVERQVADLSHDQIRTILASEMGVDRLPPSSDPGWVEIARLLERDWFKRIWTFQEAVLCYQGDASFRCGRHNIPYKTFTRASMFLGDQWTPGGIDFTGVNFSDGRARLAAIASFRDFVARRDPLPLIWLLENNVGRSCREQNDRIFAFLGLRIEDGPDFPIAVSYTQSTRDLYVEVARKIIRSQKNLRVCAQAPERVPDGGVVGLPSWVPDWTRIPMANAFEVLNAKQPYFNAARGRVHDEGVPKDPNLLRASGQIVDYVEALIDVEVQNDSSEAARREILVEQVIPLLVGTLRSCAARLNDGQIAYKIINTITLDGYTRAMNQGDSGLPPEAWYEVTCKRMVDSMLTRVSPPRISMGGIDPTQWMHAFTRQALQCVNRRFALLKNNSLGLVPKFSKQGDTIVILHGSSLPFVIRSSERGCFKMVGTCFVDGIMHGEKVNWSTGDRFDIN